MSYAKIENTVFSNNWKHVYVNKIGKLKTIIGNYPIITYFIIMIFKIKFTDICRYLK